MNFKDWIRLYVAPGHPLNQTGGFAEKIFGTFANVIFPGLGSLITHVVDKSLPTPPPITQAGIEILTGGRKVPTPFQTAFQGSYGASPSDLFPGLNLEQFSVSYDQGASLASLFPTLATVVNQTIQDLPQMGGIGQNPLIQNVPQYSVTAHACPPAISKSTGKMHGMHLSKPRRCGSTVIGAHCVPNRHMNALNPHALRRATRRLASFHGFAEKATKEMQRAFRKAGVHGVTSHRTRTGRCTTCRKTRCSCT